MGICWTASRDLPAGASANEVTFRGCVKTGFASADGTEVLAVDSGCTAGILTLGTAVIGVGACGGGAD